ncbi:MAG: hypothetical protein E5X72_00040 [Mesorhizobium sp.]|uniref:hypothetical protein n=1 Tax=Mesorhizobium sp. TaxID=1871066 RepID=UPI001216D061|nr:hypothetical protein [Mesorhizobium sp.]TIP06640.1 MAG: hypothetical protein E5X72_00040 [Mesorhizobium sp.]
MNYLDKRRQTVTPAKAKSMEADARQRMALAVSIAKKRERADVQAEILKALAEVKTGAVNEVRPPTAP